VTITDVPDIRAVGREAFTNEKGAFQMCIVNFLKAQAPPPKRVFVKTLFALMVHSCPMNESYIFKQILDKIFDRGGTGAKPPPPLSTPL